jgi:putative colanic acid biosynthesis acetyltransferase WcaF
VWQLVFQPIFWVLPAPLSRIKVWLLRIFGAKVGRDVLIRQRARVLIPWNLEVGDAVAMGTGANLYNFASISISSQVIISQGVTLCTGTHDYESPNMPLRSRPISVGRYAWVSAECFVMPGVTIGEGAVIGARSVVTRDMPAWMVCAGHPCQPIKPRTARGK